MSVPTRTHELFSETYTYNVLQFLKIQHEIFHNTVSQKNYQIAEIKFWNYGTDIKSLHFTHRGIYGFSLTCRKVRQFSNTILIFL